MTSVPDFRSLTVEALAGLVQTGELSATAVVTAALDRIEESNPTINAFVAVDGAAARAAAAEVDAQIEAGADVGPLAGVPFGVKDLADAVGYQTVKGAMHRKDLAPATTDATEVARLKAAGAVVVGKTNTPEFGWTADTYNPVFGPTLNPWNLERSPGGSSGGTGAAIAAGMVPLGTGSDGGGSIRIPSALNGLSGFKPTQGVIPSGPSALGAADLSTVGPMARRIRDVALALDCVAGPSAADLRSQRRIVGSFRAVCETPRAPSRVLWCPSLDGSAVDTEVQSVAEGALAEIRAAGVEVVDQDPFVEGAILPFLLLFFGGMVPGYREVIDSPAYDDITPGLRSMLDGTVPRLSVDSVELAREKAQAVSVRLAEVMAGFDALLSPVASGQTPRSQSHGTVNGEPTPFWVANCYPLNLARRPAGCTPAGFVADGMPVSLQIVGHQHEDLRTVELTAWVEDLLGLDLIAPELTA